MNKIIAAFDGLKYSVDTEQYAIQLAKQSGSFLTGVFLDDFTYSSYKIYELIEQNKIGDKDIRAVRNKDQETRDKAAALFEKACRKAGIEYTIHRDKNISIRDLLHESIYADLLVIHQHETFTHYTEKAPTRFIRDLLSEVQCPVLLVNQPWTPVKKLIFLYDGAPSAVHAIRAFSYLFPALEKLPSLVVSAKGYYTDLHLPDNKLMKEFMKRHYQHCTYEVVKGQEETEILKTLEKQKAGALMVLGANRRGTVSRWFKESMSDVLMKKSIGPLFIAHNK